MLLQSLPQENHRRSDLRLGLQSITQFLHKSCNFWLFFIVDKTIIDRLIKEKKISAKATTDLKVVHVNDREGIRSAKTMVQKSKTCLHVITIDEEQGKTNDGDDMNVLVCSEHLEILLSNQPRSNSIRDCGQGTLLDCLASVQLKIFYLTL